MDFKNFPNYFQPIKELVAKKAYSEEYFLDLHTQLNTDVNSLKEIHVAALVAWVSEELYTLGTSPTPVPPKPNPIKSPHPDLLELLEKKRAGEITEEEYEDEFTRQLNILETFFNNEPEAGRPQFNTNITAPLDELINGTVRIIDYLNDLYTVPFRILKKTKQRYWLNRCGYWLAVALTFFGTIFIERVVHWMVVQGLWDELVGEILAAIVMTFLVELLFEMAKSCIFWRIAHRFIRDFESGFEKLKQAFDNIPPPKPIP